MPTIYSSMKIFHFPEKLSTLLPESTVTLPPVHIRIKPTNACNHRCAYCAYRNQKLTLGQDMKTADSIPRDKMMEIINDIINMGVQAVTFSGGGEPLIYPHLPEVLRRLAGSSVRFASLTNGAFLHGELAELFSRHATWLRVSLDGWDGPSYARYRGVGAEAFAALLHNLENFQRLGGPCRLGVSLIVDEDNASHILDTLTLLQKAGVHSVKVSPCIVANDGAENNRYHRPFFETVREQIDRAMVDLVSTDFEIFDAYHELGEKFDKDYDWCPYLQILPVIGADLGVYSCQDKAYTGAGILGTLQKTGFRDFWLADRTKFFRIVPSLHCRHHCVANKKNILIHDFLDADPKHLGFV